MSPYATVGLWQSVVLERQPSLVFRLVFGSGTWKIKDELASRLLPTVDRGLRSVDHDLRDVRHSVGGRARLSHIIAC